MNASYDDFLIAGHKPPQDAHETLDECISYDQEAYEDQAHKLFATTPWPWPGGMRVAVK